MSNVLNIIVTDAAKERMESMAAGKVLRLDIKQTGCSGNSYIMEKTDKAQTDDDVIDVGGTRLAIPKTKSWMLIGMTIDYEETDFAQEFIFLNPNEKGRCGCGESFKL